METFLYSLFTGIAAFIIGQLIIHSHFSRFDKLVKITEENLKEKEETYYQSIKEFKEHIRRIEYELKETQQKCNELQKENDTISGIFIAFKEKYQFENKNHEIPNTKNEVKSKALANFV